MSTTFIAIVFLAAILLINWRLVLLLLSACLVALIVMGLGIVDGEAAAGREPYPPATATTDSGQGPAEEAASGPR